MIVYKFPAEEGAFNLCRFITLAVIGSKPPHRHFQPPEAKRCSFRVVNRSAFEKCIPQKIGKRPEAIRSRAVSNHANLLNQGNVETNRVEQPDSVGEFILSVRPRKIGQRGQYPHNICVRNTHFPLHSILQIGTQIDSPLDTRTHKFLPAVRFILRKGRFGAFRGDSFPHIVVSDISQQVQITHILRLSHKFTKQIATSLPQIDSRPQIDQIELQSFQILFPLIQLLRNFTFGREPLILEGFRCNFIPIRNVFHGRNWHSSRICAGRRLCR